MKGHTFMTPHARQEGILAQDIGDETVIYDQERHKVHRLNRTARLVWQSCDGQKTVADLAGILHRDLDLPADDSVVWLALDRLEKAHLLKERLSRPEEAGAISRRQ